MSLHLITGYAGHEHVQSNDEGSFNIAAFGDGNYVLSHGNNFAATLINNNTLQIKDGDLVMQGRHVRLKSNTTEELAIENCTQGMQRNDLLCVHYSREDSTGIESVGFKIIQGLEMPSSPADPEYAKGVITDGDDTECDFPLYRIPIIGMVTQEPVALFTVKEADSSYRESVDKLLTDIVDGTQVVAKANTAVTANTAAKATNADNAKNAEKATVAESATTAGYATSAGSAGKADKADYATSAGSASTATKATSADSATNATNATKADKAAQLETARKINGVEFNGTKNITIEDNTKLSNDKDFILVNKSSLTFRDNVCKLSNSKITADSLADVYFTADCKEAAIKADISVETYAGYVNITAARTPESTLTATVHIRVV